MCELPKKEVKESGNQIKEGTLKRLTQNKYIYIYEKWKVEKKNSISNKEEK